MVWPFLKLFFQEHVETKSFDGPRDPSVTWHAVTTVTAMILWCLPSAIKIEMTFAKLLRPQETSGLCRNHWPQKTPTKPEPIIGHERSTPVIKRSWLEITLCNTTTGGFPLPYWFLQGICTLKCFHYFWEQSHHVKYNQVQHVKYMMRCCATTRGVRMELEVIPGQCWVLLNWNVLGEPAMNCNLLSRDFQCNVYM